jgi:hypothetical protein
MELGMDGAVFVALVPPVFVMETIVPPKLSEPFTPLTVQIVAMLPVRMESGCIVSVHVNAILTPLSTADTERVRPPALVIVPEAPVNNVPPSPPMRIVPLTDDPDCTKLNVTESDSYKANEHRPSPAISPDSEQDVTRNVPLQVPPY